MIFKNAQTALILKVFDDTYHNSIVITGFDGWDDVTHIVACIDDHTSANIHATALAMLQNKKAFAGIKRVEIAFDEDSQDSATMYHHSGTESMPEGFYKEAYLGVSINKDLKPARPYHIGD